MFARVLRHPALVIAIYAVLVPLAALLAMRIPTEAGIDRLIVPGDPEFVATRAFQAVFPESQRALLVFESDDPWSPASIAKIDRATAALSRVPRVRTFSVLDALRAARPEADLRELAEGTRYFRDQALVGDHFMTVVLDLDVHGGAERDETLAAIDTALDGIEVRRIGAPYVNAWLEDQSGHATARSSAVFAVLLVLVVLVLYRSVRTLLAIVIALGAAVALTLAVGDVLGFSFTIVSALVPLTVMVTTLATLTYVHSRFVDQPEGVELAEHHLAALRSKLLPVTASTIAAATGFAALAVSKIRPIREMGIWTAIGLVLAWVVAVTLFPALQRVLRTPTSRRVALRTATYDRIANVLPQLTYRYRWPLLLGGLALSVASAIAVAGIPTRVDAISNIDQDTAIARDLLWFRKHAGNFDVAHVWIHLETPTATDPDVLRVVDRFQSALAATPDVVGVTGPTTPLRLRRYLEGHPDGVPDFADIEQLLLTRPELRSFIDLGLTDLKITVLFRSHFGGYEQLARRVAVVWNEVATPAVGGARVQVVGEAMLEAKIGDNLVPTLVESLAFTVAIILLVFLVVFRSGVERLLAMIPSVCALLVTLFGLRLFGGSLNVATIIIATTVLGTTENDQMHLFHHMHERPGASFEVRLRHTLRIAGRAVVLATLINAIGFLGLSTSSFPPLQQFGVLTAAAFTLAMIADFTILPAALWIASRERPASLETERSPQTPPPPS